MRGVGSLIGLDYAAAVMLHLGDMLMASDERIRVTIERNPETEKFTVKREVCP